MKQTGIFDIIDNIPIVFICELKRLNPEEWEVENLIQVGHWWVFSKSHFAVTKGRQVEFIETQSPIKDKRGKCKILKII